MFSSIIRIFQILLVNYVKMSHLVLEYVDIHLYWFVPCLIQSPEYETDYNMLLYFSLFQVRFWYWEGIHSVISILCLPDLSTPNHHKPCTPLLIIDRGKLIWCLTGRSEHLYGGLTHSSNYPNSTQYNSFVRSYKMLISLTTVEVEQLYQTCVWHLR